MNKYCIFVISVFGCHHHKIVHIILMSVVSNFEIYSVTHSTRVWNHWNVHVEWVYIRVWRIFGYSNIFWYKYLFVSYSYHFFIWIYSDIRSYCFFSTNILRYSFVSFFWYKYIRIFIHIVFKYEYIQEEKSNLGAKKSKS